MMRVKLLIVALVFLVGVSVVSIFRVLDAALEIDGLKSQISLQKDSLKFLRDVSNQSLQSCTFNLVGLERIAKENGYPLLREEQFVLIGSFKFEVSSNTCILSVEQVAL